MADSVVTNNSSRRNLAQLIEAFKREVMLGSITPLRDGSILEKLLDLSKEEMESLEYYLSLLAQNTAGANIFGTVDLSELINEDGKARFNEYATGLIPAVRVVYDGNMIVGMVQTMLNEHIDCITQTLTISGEVIRSVNYPVFAESEVGTDHLPRSYSRSILNGQSEYSDWVRLDNTFCVSLDKVNKGNLRIDPGYRYFVTHDGLTIGELFLVKMDRPGEKNSDLDCYGYSMEVMITHCPLEDEKIVPSFDDYIHFYYRYYYHDSLPDDSNPGWIELFSTEDKAFLEKLKTSVFWKDLSNSKTSDSLNLPQNIPLTVYYDDENFEPLGFLVCFSSRIDSKSKHWNLLFTCRSLDNVVGNINPGNIDNSSFFVYARSIAVPTPVQSPGWSDWELVFSSADRSAVNNRLTAIEKKFVPQNVDISLLCKSTLSDLDKSLTYVVKDGAYTLGKLWFVPMTYDLGVTYAQIFVGNAVLDEETFLFKEWDSMSGGVGIGRAYEYDDMTFCTFVRFETQIQAPDNLDWFKVLSSDSMVYDQQEKSKLDTLWKFYQSFPAADGITYGVMNRKAEAIAGVGYAVLAQKPASAATLALQSISQGKIVIKPSDPLYEEVVSLIPEDILEDIDLNMVQTLELSAPDLTEEEMLERAINDYRVWKQEMLEQKKADAEMARTSEVNEKSEETGKGDLTVENNKTE